MVDRSYKRVGDVEILLSLMALSTHQSKSLQGVTNYSHKQPAELNYISLTNTIKNIYLNY